MRKITVIPQTRNVFSAASISSVAKRKVAGYARVSTDSDEQFTSYEAQVEYYTNYIKSNPRWEFIGVYTDEGISGLNTKHRDGFNQMIADALDGKIELIVTKSVSRFARNTVDSLTTIRKLKDKGVEVYFEKESIWTFDSKGELLLTIMSSLAQEESRSISENVTWSVRKRFADGRVSLAYSSFLGYDKGPDGNLVINPEEAKIVVLIYQMFINGKSPLTIARYLTEQGIPTPGGKTNWQTTTIKSILTNEKYKGDALLQKSFTIDFLSKKTKTNTGEIPQYYIEGNHEAIISPEEFDLVQAELERRKMYGRTISTTSVFSSKIRCCDCGCFYGQKVWHSNDKYRRLIWQCNGKFKTKGSEKCKTPTVDEEYIQLTDQYHNELLYDLMPAVEGRYSTYAEDTTPEGLEASRDHRGFGGFSMGSVTTWRTFEHCLPYFRYFMPSSGNLTTDARYMDAIVDYYGYDWNDFFIFACSGTSDFAYYAFNMQILNMAASSSGHFRMADNEAEGSLAYRVKEGYSHDGRAMMEYAYNGLCWFWNGGNEPDTAYTVDSVISDVINDPAFGDYGRLILPVDEWYYSGETLKDLRLTWYTGIDPNKTVEIVNYMHDQAASGDVIFYDIYTAEEKAADPEKNDTGLFFFKGEPGSKFAVCNAGGGFAYVGAMHDSFPHALELSRKGYNAFALIYRPGAQTACEDLARAISFIFAHADELQVDTECYSLWGGSAGARMAAYLGTYGPAAFGGEELPRPGAVIMQYTGHSEYSELDPPTYACVGTNDGIASWRTMQRRLQAMESVGIPTEFHAYEGLSHGFGLGTGTVAEGWIDDAVAFWEKQY